jgi:hypothetical protein
MMGLPKRSELLAATVVSCLCAAAWSPKALCQTVSPADPPRSPDSPPGGAAAPASTAAPRTSTDAQPNSPSAPSEREESVTNVAWSTGATNPAAGDKAALKYVLSQPKSVTIRLYDPDGGLVRTLCEAVAKEPGEYQETWDGRDDKGNIVPNEAYTALIETGSGLRYDPSTSSGGIVGDITDAKFDYEAGTMVYTLPAPARVLIRLGIKNGPMLKTLVDWKPRITGSITEYWDGFDESKVVRLRDQKDFTVLITYVTLPEATIITYGNDKTSYRAYKFAQAKDHLKRPVRPREPDAAGRLIPENLVPPAWTRAPRTVMTFPKLGDGGIPTPEVSETVDVRIDVEQEDKDYLLQDQFEIIFFVDNVFFAEAERGYLPFNWPWELKQLPPGDHVLTANISSFRGQVGVASRKIRILKPDE